MYNVDIWDLAGPAAVFTVDDPIVALDLVARAIRAGLGWRVIAGEREVLLSLEDLRELAEQYGTDVPAAAERLREIDAGDLMASTAALN